MVDPKFVDFRDEALIIQNFLGLDKFVIVETRSEIKRRKFWNGIIMGRDKFWQKYLKPEFLDNFQIAPGTLREGDINLFDKSGCRLAIGGIILDYLDFFNREKIIKIEKILNRDFLSQKLEDWIRKKKDVKIVELKEHINERDTNKIDIGGFVPNKYTEEIILGKEPNIVYRDASNPNESIDGDKLNEIRNYTQNPQMAPKDWKTPDWCIAKIKEDGSCEDILIKPKSFPDPEYGEEIGKVTMWKDGGLIIFTKPEHSNKYHLVEGGIRAPATAVIPGILNYPLEYFDEESLNKIKEATGETEEPSFVAAIEITFKRNPGGCITRFLQISHA